MSLENIRKEKCRICLGTKENMTPYFEPIYRLSQNDPNLYSLADILQSVSKVEIEEAENPPENVCFCCTKIIIDFNNLLKVFQENQYCLQRLVCKVEIDNKDCRPQIDEYADQETLLSQDYSEDNNHFECVDICSTDVGKCESDHNVTVEQQSDDGNNEIVSTKYTCDDCGDIFLIKSGFSQHMLLKHNICVQVEDFDQYSSEIKLKMPKEYPGNTLRFVSKQTPVRKTDNFKCQICKELFLLKEDLKVHQEVHRTHRCEHCGSAFIKNSYLKDHILMHSQARLFVCNICGKAFKYRNGLSVHKSSHYNYRGFMCETCGQGFNARSTLQTHIKLKHTDEKNFPCPACNLRFKEKSWLDKHFTRKHTSDRTKDFVCSVCGIAYLNKYTLTRHVADKHTENPKSRRHFCQICEKSYTMKNKLVTHMQKKHFAVDP